MSSDFYEERASEFVSAANESSGRIRDAYEEVASELLTLARVSREAGA